MTDGAGMFETVRARAAPDAIAPDGSEVRILCRTPRGSMAQFTLPPGAVSRAVAHRTVEEVWYVVSGAGRMWRRAAGGRPAETVALVPGVSVSLPVGTAFQFRCDGALPLVAVGTTMPPWPGEDEAYPVDGAWPPAV